MREPSVFWRGFVISALCFHFASTSGCSRSDPRDVSTANRLTGLTTIYLDYAVAKGGGPANESELRGCMRNLAGFKVAQGEHDPNDLDALLVSQRDGEPFVIRYGVGISQSVGREAPPIAFERTGREGTRFVAFANGHVECIPEDELEELISKTR